MVRSLPTQSKTDDAEIDLVDQRQVTCDPSRTDFVDADCVDWPSVPMLQPQVTTHSTASKDLVPRGTERLGGLFFHKRRRAQRARKSI